MDTVTLSKPLLIFWTARRATERQECVFSKVAGGFVIEVRGAEGVVRSAVAPSLDEMFRLEGDWRDAWSADGWTVV